MRPKLIGFDPQFFFLIPACTILASAAMAAPPPARQMDYGPFLSCSVLRPRSVQTPATQNSSSFRPAVTDGGELLAVKGIVVSVGNGAYVTFDSDLLSVAGGWIGGFLDLSQTNLGQYKGDFPPRIAGDLQFSTLTEPGWDDPSGHFADPRDGHQGPLPKSWGRYSGLYRHDNQVIFSYSVGDLQILESPGSFTSGGQIAFTRTFQLSRSKANHRLLICELPSPTDAMDSIHDFSASLRDGDHEVATALVGAEQGISLSIADRRRIELILKPSSAFRTFSVVIARLPATAKNSSHQLLKTAPPPQDLSGLCRGGKPIWPETFRLPIAAGPNASAYAVDTIAIPERNPWNAWMRTSGVDFFSNGQAAVCTFSGDVWIASGLDPGSSSVTWKRFAAGLYEPLGLRIVDDQIYVLGRDQITRLHDLSGSGEADFYENFCNDWPASPIYHGFAMDLQTDADGNFYYANCGNQAPLDLRMHGVMLKVDRYGQECSVVATGLRAPNGSGMGPHGELVCSTGMKGWQTSASHDGCLQRVRYTGKPLHLPVEFHTHRDRIAITFSEPLDAQTAADEQSYGIECWNYRWSETYGSPDLKPSDPANKGHDSLDVKAAALSSDGRTVTLSVPGLKPVMQMAIQMHLQAADGSPVDCEIDNTINRIPG